MYTEVVVPQKDSPVMNILRYVAGALCIVCLLTGITILPLALVGAAIFGFLFWFISQRVGIEYQYCLIDEDLDIDKVIGNTRRKHIFTVKTSQVVLVAPMHSSELQHYDSWPTLDASAKDSENAPYAMICHVNGNKKRILLQMNDELLRGLKRKLGSKVIA